MLMLDTHILIFAVNDAPRPAERISLSENDMTVQKTASHDKDHQASSDCAGCRKRNEPRPYRLRTVALAAHDLVSFHETS